MTSQETAYRTKDGFTTVRGIATRFDRDELLFTLGTALATVVALVPVLQLWRMDIRVPFAYGGDATGNLMIIQNLVDGGWVNTNSGLGAPFGQTLYDTPVGTDNLNLLVLKLLAVVTRDPAVTLNLFYLLSFPATAVAAVLVLRRLGLSRPASFAAALLFAFAPYHFWRGETHLLLSSYIAVPLGAFLVLRTIAGEPLFARRESGHAPWVSGRSVTTLVLCAVIGSTGLYYAFFTGILLSVATVVAAAARGRWTILFTGLGAVVAIGAVVLANVAPSLAYSVRHGANEEAIARSADESELFGLKLTQLLLPVDGHRLEPLARRSLHYERTTLTPANEFESGQTLGLIGDVGFFALLFAALAGAVAGARWRPPPLLRSASLPTIVAVLFGITTGLATLFAYAATPNFHAPGRISIFIAFFSLLAIGVLLDAGIRRWARTSGSWIAAAAAAAIVVVGIADQTTRLFVPRWDEVAQAWHEDEAYAQAAGAALPTASSVFQLPYAAFPENDAPGRTIDYDGARPYVHGAGLRWSYGAMKGRLADWSAALATAPAEVATTAAAAAGFQALQLDRDAFVGDPPEAALRERLGEPLLTSGDGRYALFDLRPYRAELIALNGRMRVDAVGTDALHPVRLVYGEGFEQPRRGEDPRGRRSLARTARIGVFNPSPRARAVAFETELASGDGAERAVELHFPDGSSATARATGRPTIVARELLLPPGRSELVATIEGAASGGTIEWVGTHVPDRALIELVRDRG
jgi:phosphoglycerol transferase